MFRQLAETRPLLTTPYEYNTLLRIPALDSFQLTRNTFDDSEVRQRLLGELVVLVTLTKISSS